MRDLNREIEWISEKNPPLRTYDDYREMVNRSIAAEAALAAKTEECERLRNIFKEMEWEPNCFGTAYNCPACGELKEDGHNADCWIGNAIKKGAE